MKDWPPYLAIGALVAAVSCVGLALYLTPPVLLAIGEVLKAFGVMVAVIVSGSAAGVSVAGTVPMWAAPALSGSVTVVSVVTVYYALRQVARRAREDPYDWVVPLFAIAGALCLDLAKDLELRSAALKAATTAVVALFVVVAGALWKSRHVGWRVVSVLLVVLPPMAVLIRNMNGIQNVRASFAEVDPFVWFRLGLFGAVALGVAAVHALAEGGGWKSGRRRV